MFRPVLHCLCGVGAVWCQGRMSIRGVLMRILIDCCSSAIYSVNLTFVTHTHTNTHIHAHACIHAHSLWKGHTAEDKRRATLWRAGRWPLNIFCFHTNFFSLNIFKWTQFSLSSNLHLRQLLRPSISDMMFMKMCIRYLSYYDMYYDTHHKK